jgi:hypothetical protein
VSTRSLFAAGNLPAIRQAGSGAYYSSKLAKEPTMPANITRLMVGTAMASAIAVVSASQAGSTQSLTQLFSLITTF